MEAPKLNPELVVEYFNFLFDFLRKPRVCIEGFSQPQQGTEKASIKVKLAIYAIIGVLVATLLVQIGKAIGMAPDGSSSVAVVNKLGVIVLPFATLIIIIVISALAHALIKVISFLSKLLGHEVFKGDVNNTVNAALAFSAFAIPLFTLVIVFIRIVAAQVTEPSPTLLIATVVPTSIISWIYLVASFAGAHKISWNQAIYLFGATVSAIVYLGKLSNSVSIN